MYVCVCVCVCVCSIYTGICAVHAKCTFKGRKDWGRCKDHSIQLFTHAVVKSRFLRIRILPTEKREPVSL